MRFSRTTLLSLLFVAIGTGAQAQLPRTAGVSARTQLRDITIVPGAKATEVKFTLAGPVRTVVVQRIKSRTAQIRMQAVAATDDALSSALLHPGIKSVRSHIERKNVLVTNVTFSYDIQDVRVSYRKDELVTVSVTRITGDNTPRELDTPSVASKPAPNTKRVDSTNTTSKVPAPTGLYRKLRPTIIIDPGHGGKDPGAIGIGKVKEKSVVLAVSQQLRKYLREEMPLAKIIMTRNSDVFISLDRRRQIAQSRRATMLVSVHCNSMPEKPSPANGCECYVMSTDDNRDLAEGSAKEVVEDRSLMTVMALGTTPTLPPLGIKHASRSRQLAASICSHLGKNSPMTDRGVRRADFYVLTETPMPSVLVECGYVSNTSEARVLGSVEGQQKIARGICDGILRYLSPKKKRKS